jgi:putative transposase
MSRKHRICFPGATYHITARGNRKADIFLEKEDYQKYLTIAEKVHSTHPITLHSYCLMPNHVHLLIETVESPIPLFMKELQARYAIYFNKKYDFVGHVFQGRYGAQLIDSVTYFLEVTRYIHRNPLEANLVLDPAKYKWSSYTAYLSKVNNPLISTSKTLSYFQDSRYMTYQQFVEKEDKQVGEGGR